MIDAMDACGVPPALKDKVNDNINLAAAALGASTYYSTVSLAAGVTAAATGVAAPVGAAIALQGVVGGFVLGEIAENATANSESSFQEAMASQEDCEDPKKPRRLRPTSTTTMTIAGTEPVL